MPPAPRTFQIPALTGLRAVAAGMVFFYHWLFDTPNTWALVPRAFFSQGYLGVAVFFALSGFLITVRYSDDLRDHRVSTVRYLLKRFVRIYPVYFFVLTFFVVILGRPIGFAPTTLYQGLINYSMTQALFPALMLSGVSTAWTLTIEEMFYVAAPRLMLLLGGNAVKVYVRRMLTIAVLLSGTCLLVALILSILPQVWPGFILGASLEFIVTNSILGRLPDFLVGMLAGFLFLHREQVPWLTRNAARIAWMCTLGLAVTIIATQAAEAPGAWIVNRILSIVASGWTAGLILSLSCDVTRSGLISRVLGSPPVEYAGKISYVLYLVQLTEPVQYIYWVIIGDVLSRVPHAIVLYVAASAISAVVYQLVEVPAKRGLTRLLKLGPGY